MKAREDKCYFQFGTQVLKKGVATDRKLNFIKHVTTFCNKTSKKIQALARNFSYMLATQRKLLMNAYFFSQFGYCPLVWMNLGTILNNHINGLHERAPKLVLNDFSLAFSEL